MIFLLYYIKCHLLILKPLKSNLTMCFMRRFKDLDVHYKWIQAIENVGIVDVDPNYTIRNMEIMLSDKEF